MKFSVGYFFSVGPTSCGGTEKVNAKDAETAVAHARKLHPNAKLRITTVRDETGRKHRVMAHGEESK